MDHLPSLGGTPHIPTLFQGVGATIMPENASLSNDTELIGHVSMAKDARSLQHTSEGSKSVSQHGPEKLIPLELDMEHLGQSAVLMT